MISHLPEMESMCHLEPQRSLGEQQEAGFQRLMKLSALVALPERAALLCYQTLMECAHSYGPGIYKAKGEKVSQISLPTLPDPQRPPWCSSVVPWCLVPSESSH